MSDYSLKRKALKSALDLGALTQDQYDAAEQRITSEHGEDVSRSPGYAGDVNMTQEEALSAEFRIRGPNRGGQLSAGGVPSQRTATADADTAGTDSPPRITPVSEPESSDDEETASRETKSGKHVKRNLGYMPPESAGLEDLMKATLGTLTTGVLLGDPMSGETTPAAACLAFRVSERMLRVEPSHAGVRAPLCSSHCHARATTADRTATSRACF